MAKGGRATSALVDRAQVAGPLPGADVLGLWPPDLWQWVQAGIRRGLRTLGLSKPLAEEKFPSAPPSPAALAAELMGCQPSLHLLEEGERNSCRNAPCLDVVFPSPFPSQMGSSCHGTRRGILGPGTPFTLDT